MKVYIAGKISGDSTYREKFRKAQKALEGEGFIVLNQRKPNHSETGM